MLFFYPFPMQELVTAIILLYTVPVSCGILYHSMFCSHALLPLSNVILKIYCNFFALGVLVLALVLFDMSCTYFCTNLINKKGDLNCLCN